MRLSSLLVATLLFSLIPAAFAADLGLPAFTSTATSGGGQTYSLSLQTLLLLTSLSFLPAVMLLMTSFTRIIIVLSLLRSALKAFMLRQTREKDLALFVQISNSEPLQSADQVPLKILVPAYVISELKTAFQIGFVVFIPFLIIDMVVASILMSMGMMMVSPAMISLPFKIMLFVLADGWNLLIGSLVHSFYT